MSILRNATKINFYTKHDSIYSIKLTEQNEARLDDSIVNGGNRLMEFEGIYGETIRISASQVVSYIIWDAEATETFLEDEKYAAQERIVQEGG